MLHLDAIHSTNVYIAWTKNKPRLRKSLCQHCEIAHTANKTHMKLFNGFEWQIENFPKRVNALSVSISLYLSLSLFLSLHVDYINEMMQCEWNGIEWENEKKKERDRENIYLIGISELRWSSNNFLKWMSRALHIAHTQIIQITIANCTFRLQFSFSLTRSKSTPPMLFHHWVESSCTVPEFLVVIYAENGFTELHNFPLQTVMFRYI